MATAIIMDFEGATTAQYDEVLELMGLDRRLPEHALFHCAGATSTGLRVVDVWEDMATFQHFAATQIGPYTAQVGIEGPPHMEIIELAQIREQAGDQLTYLQIVRLPIDGDMFHQLDEMVLKGAYLPEGCIYHVNGPQANGEYCVIDAWTSREICEDFMAHQVGPVVEAAGITEQPTIESLDLYKTLTQPALATA